MISFADTMARDINHKLEKYGANILIVPRTDNLALTYGGMTLGGVSFEMTPIRQAQLSQIKTIRNAENIAAVGPITLGTVKINDRPALLAGIDFDAAGILKPWWKMDGPVPGKNELMAGAQAANLLQLSKGRNLSINGNPMRVTTILGPTGSQDDQLLFTRLETAQFVLDKPGEVSMVEVAALCNACPVDDMVMQISEKLPTAKVMAIQQVVKGRMETLAQFRRFSYGLAVVVLLIGGLVVLVTLMGSVKERTEEIGIFRAIGFRQQHIIRIIFIETGLTQCGGGHFGIHTGYCRNPDRPEFFWRFRCNGDVPRSLAGLRAAISLALVVGILAGVYPAMMAARMDPNQALKTI